MTTASKWNSTVAHPVPTAEDVTAQHVESTICWKVCGAGNWMDTGFVKAKGAQYCSKPFDTSWGFCEKWK